jgi:hypothetical protein
MCYNYMSIHCSSKHTLLIFKKAEIASTSICFTVFHFRFHIYYSRFLCERFPSSSRESVLQMKSTFLFLIFVSVQLSLMLRFNSNCVDIKI